MSRYLETAADLHREVGSFVERLGITDPQALVQLGHIINLAVRCNPRQAQGTVRRNIVAAAMRGFCTVTMTRETDLVNGREFNKIHIQPKQR